MQLNLHVFDYQAFYEVDSSLLEHLNIVPKNRNSFTDKETTFLAQDVDGENLIQALHDRNIKFRRHYLLDEKSPIFHRFCQLAAY
jgi:hypothetical protein